MKLTIFSFKVFIFFHILSIAKAALQKTNFSILLIRQYSNGNLIKNECGIKKLVILQSSTPFNSFNLQSSQRNWAPQFSNNSVLPHKNACFYQNEKPEGSEMASLYIDMKLTSGFVYSKDTFYEIPEQEWHEINSTVLIINHVFYDTNTHPRRRKRSVKFDHFGTHDLGLYLEVYILVDSELVDHFRHENKDKETFIYTSMNHLSTLYRPIGLHIVHKGFATWQRKAVVHSSTLLNEIVNELQQNRPPFQVDNTQLIVYEDFGSNTGKAFSGAMCTTHSVGYCVYSSGVSPVTVAYTMAHEIAHSFNKRHNEKDCIGTRQNPHIMDATSGRKPVHTWSKCTLEELPSLILKRDYCLKNPPDLTHSHPICGNGIVESDEQCDVGLIANSTCCDSKTCRFKPGAQCASGECCDQAKCLVKSAGHLCSPIKDECDLPEFCNGQDEFCGTDYYKKNGTYCDSEKGLCFSGQCGSRDQICRNAFGPMMKGASKYCYGYDNFCSHLYCSTQTDEELPESVNYVPIQSIAVNGKIIYCYSLMSRSQQDLKIRKRSISAATGNVRGRSQHFGQFGVTVDGSFCGKESVCFDKQCHSMKTFTSKLCNCNGQGVCNNADQCHCFKGYSGKDCSSVGCGGTQENTPRCWDDGDFILIAIFVFLALLLVTIFVLSITFLLKKGYIKLNYQDIPQTKWKPAVKTKPRNQTDTRKVTKDLITQPKLDSTSNTNLKVCRNISSFKEKKIWEHFPSIKEKSGKNKKLKNSQPKEFSYQAPSKTSKGNVLKQAAMFEAHSAKATITSHRN